MHEEQRDAVSLTAAKEENMIIHGMFEGQWQNCAKLWPLGETATAWNPLSHVAFNYQSSVSYPVLSSRNPFD